MRKKRKGKKMLKKDDSPVLLGIDVGFGDVKAVAEDLSKKLGSGQRFAKFPTSYARIEGEKNLGLGTDRTYRYNGNIYKLGKEAVRSSHSRAIQDVDTLIKFSPLLVFRALEELAVRYGKNKFDDLLKAPKHISVGLPLEHFREHKEILRKTLQTFQVSGYHVNFNSKVDVRAQGQGVQTDFLCNVNGAMDQFLKATIAILDIGYNTVDVFCIDEGRPSSEHSFMLSKAGLCMLVKRLTSTQTWVDLKLTGSNEVDAKEALKKGDITIQGKQYDLRNDIDRLSEEYAEDMFNAVNEEAERFLKRANKLIIAGGGSKFVQAYFERKYAEYPEFLHFMDSREYSNAKGYLSFIKRGYACLN